MSHEKMIIDSLKNFAEKSGNNLENLKHKYILERMILRLISNQNFSKKIVLKGGFAGLLFYGSERTTIDIDILVNGISLDHNMSDIYTAIEDAAIDDGIWIKFVEESGVKMTGEYGGRRLEFRAKIGGEPKPEKVALVRRYHLDIGVVEKHHPDFGFLKIKPLIDGDGPNEIQVYPLELIVAEKIHALIVHGELNSRAKDLYDLSIFLPQTNREILQKTIKEIFDVRQTLLPQEGIKVHFENLNLNVMSKRWNKAVVPNISKTKNFDDCRSFVIAQLDVLGI